jgi:hypothetical protein
MHLVLRPAEGRARTGLRQIVPDRLDPVRRDRGTACSPHRPVEALHAKGVETAYLYGALGPLGATGGLQQLNAFFLLTAAPETFNLPRAPSLASGLATVAGLALASLLFLAARRGDRQ